MSFKEFLQMNQEERNKKLKELQLELIKLNAQVATGTPPKNAGQLKRLKKDIARLMLLKNIGEKKAIQEKTQQLKPTPTSDKRAINNKRKKTSKKQNE